MPLLHRNRRRPPWSAGIAALAALAIPLAWAMPHIGRIAVTPPSPRLAAESQLPATSDPAAAVSRTAPRASAADPAPSASPADPPDIYYLIFDRYGSSRALDIAYGYDNRPFLDGLRERGFYVAEDSHANYTKTWSSLAATLSLEYLDEVVERVGPQSEDFEPLYAMLDDHRVGRFLKEQGYEYVHIGSYYDQTRTSSIADVNTRAENTYALPRSVVEHGIIPSLDVPDVAEAATRPERSKLRAYRHAALQFDDLRRIGEMPGPKFVFAHILLPHTPYVFAADGSYVAEPQGSGAEQHNAQLDYTNERIRQVIEPLLERPVEERPVIIVQADEGPFPRRYAADQDGFDWSTATEDELETKFGILNAWYLPRGGTEKLYPHISSVNTFRLLFAEYFAANLPLLPDRTWTARSRNLPYDLTEITDRLPSLR